VRWSGPATVARRAERADRELAERVERGLADETQRQTQAVGGCERPVRVVGRCRQVDTQTGEIVLGS